MPSKEQIEAAAKAWFDFDTRNSRTTTKWENAKLFYEQAARYALTAAAEVARQEQYRKLGIDPANPDPDGSDYHLMNAIDAAAEVAEGEKFAQAWKTINQPEPKLKPSMFSTPEAYSHAMKIYAAEVRKNKMPWSTDEMIDAARKAERVATIKRCAQVVQIIADRHNSPYGCEPYAKALLTQIVVDIRALACIQIADAIRAKKV